TSGAALDVYLYTDARELTPDAKTWTAILQSTPDAATSWSIEAVGPSNQIRTSVPRTLTGTSDTIDDSAIYVWQPSTGTFHILDMIKETDVVLPSNSAS